MEKSYVLISTPNSRKGGVLGHCAKALFSIVALKSFSVVCYSVYCLKIIGAKSFSMSSVTFSTQYGAISYMLKFFYAVMCVKINTRRHINKMGPY